MSSRLGDESARARAESLDPVLAAGGDEAWGTDGVSGTGGVSWGIGGVPGVPGNGRWKPAVRSFRRQTSAMFGLGFLVFMFLACFVLVRFAPSPTDLHLTDPHATTSGPSWSHWFGTDLVTRDSLSRVLHGGQVSLKVALGIAVLSTVIGVVIGALSGFYRGWLDGLLMRFTDLWIALPAIPFLAVAVSIDTIDLGPFGSLDLGSPFGITVLLSLLLWGSIARVVRGATLALREREFVDAARAVGASNTRIIVRHVIPNCSGPIIVNATLVVAEAILIESTLSFLGFGIQPPTPSWGNLLNDSIATVEQYWWLTVFPGLAIFLTVLAVNFVGDGLRDALDPRRQVRA